MKKIPGEDPGPPALLRVLPKKRGVGTPLITVFCGLTQRRHTRSHDAIWLMATWRLSSVRSALELIEVRFVSSANCSHDEPGTSATASGCIKLSHFSPTKIDIMKGGTQGFPRHEVSDKQEVLFEDVSPSTAFSIRQQLTNWKCRRRRNVFEQNFLFVAHFVSGKPLCPALHNIKMRVSSKKSFTLLTKIELTAGSDEKHDFNDPDKSEFRTLSTVLCAQLSISISIPRVPSKKKRRVLPPRLFAWWTGCLFTVRCSLDSTTKKNAEDLRDRELLAWFLSKVTSCRSRRATLWCATACQPGSRSFRVGSRMMVSVQ